MLPAFDKISAVPGVLGLFTASPGKLRANTLPAFFLTDSMPRAAEPLLGAWNLAERHAIPVMDMVLTFGDTRVVVTRVSPNCLMLVVCQPSLDLAELSDVLRALEPEYESISSFQAQKERAGHGAFKWGGAGDDFIKKLTETGLTIPGRKEPAKGVEPPVLRGVGTSPLEAAATIVPRTSLSEVDRMRLREILSRYVGPVAPLLLASALRGRSNPRDVVERLAREIESPRDRQSFLLDAREIIDGR